MQNVADINKQKQLFRENTGDLLTLYTFLGWCLSCKTSFFGDIAMIKDRELENFSFNVYSGVIITPKKCVIRHGR
jgi:hypothetical protein